MNNRVLIIGVSGFTGKHLSQYLKKYGYEVYGTSFSDKYNDTIKCDISSKSSLSTVLKSIEADYIIHLAGVASPAHVDVESFYSLNTIGTINILDTLLELGQNPKKIILPSSAIVYGNQDFDVLHESLCPRPSNYYGTSKYAMECLASNYFSRLNIIIPRVFNYVGRGQSENFLIPKLVKHFKEKKKEIALGNLDVIREFNDVKFVCEVYKRLLEDDVTSEVVNICSGRGIKLLDTIVMMNEIAGYKIDVKVNPAFVRKDEIRSLTGSPEKLFNMIGSVEQCSFRETLRKMYEA